MAERCRKRGEASAGRYRAVKGQASEGGEEKEARREALLTCLPPTFEGSE